MISIPVQKGIVTLTDCRPMMIYLLNFLVAPAHDTLHAAYLGDLKRSAPPVASLLAGMRKDVGSDDFLFLPLIEAVEPTRRAHSLQRT